MKLTEITHQQTVNAKIFLSKKGPFSSSVSHANIVQDADFSGEWEEILDRYAPNRRNDGLVQVFNLDSHDQISVPFAFELAGSHGADYFVFIDKDISPQELSTIRHRLRNLFDVAKVYFYRCKNVSFTSRGK